MRRWLRPFRHHPEASENFLMHFVMESPAVAAHPLRLPSFFFLSQEVRGEEGETKKTDAGDCLSQKRT